MDIKYLSAVRISLYYRQTFHYLIVQLNYVGFQNILLLWSHGNLTILRNMVYSVCCLYKDIELMTVNLNV